MEVRDPADAAPRAGVRHCILGTAGHIDHGKTSLVRALTGTDTDRLPEEKRRGMTIELGFADLRVGDFRFGIVDVPGHERFVRTMVAGATGIDVALVVVAADDSVMPQTVEHVEILDLLGVSRGVVAVTKVDVVDSEMVELVTDDVRSLLSGTGLAGAPIVPVSSVTGTGLERLRRALVGAASDVPLVRTDPPFRLAIDRVFTVRGRGTIVTGSVLRGAVTPGDELVLHPVGLRCRVRGLQSHGEDAAAIDRGTRAAVHVGGVDRERIERGMELATPGYLHGSHLVDVELTCLSSHPRGVRSTGKVRLCMGTREVPVRVVLPGGGVLEGGRSGLAQLRSGQPLVCTYGQRFILRDENGARTIGGGRVLRPRGRRRRGDVSRASAALQRLASGSAEARLAEYLRQCGFATPTDLEVCAATGIELADLPGVYASLDASGGRVTVRGTVVRVVPAVVDDLLDRLLRRLERHHLANPDVPGLHEDAVLGWLERRTDRLSARSLLDDLMAEGRLKRLGRFMCLPAFAPKLSRADERTLDGLVDQITAGGFSPPLLDAAEAAGGVERKRLSRLATLAVATGRLVRLQDKLYLPPEGEARLKETVRRLIEQEGSVTVARLREALGSSRKYCVPYLEYLDRIGFTRRVGDQRVLV